MHGRAFRRAMVCVSIGLLSVACSSSSEPPVTPARTAVEPAPAPTPSSPTPPPSPPPPAVDPRVACRSAEDCVFVANACGGITPAARDHADEVLTEQRALSTHTECAREITPPSALRCEGGQCVAHALAHPELYACRRDRDCAVIDVSCQWGPAIAVRSQDAARTILGPPGAPECPGILPQMPEARCAFGFCARASDVYPPAD